MVNRSVSNYDLARDKAEREFAQCDIRPMVKKYGLKQDSQYTYISFLRNDYRISKETGRVELLCGDAPPVHAGFNESLTIFDVLGYAKKDAALSGEFCSVMDLKGVAKSANPGGDMYGKFAQHFAGRSDDLRKACEALGGTAYPVGEVAYQIPLFDFLPVILQFWDADEEFGAQLTVKWDTNTLDFMHFETTFYAAGCFMQRLIRLSNP